MSVKVPPTSTRRDMRNHGRASERQSHDSVNVLLTQTQCDEIALARPSPDSEKFVETLAEQPALSRAACRSDPHHHQAPCACTGRTVFRPPPRNSAESSPTPWGDTPRPRSLSRRRPRECPGHCRHSNKFSSARRCTACFSGSACLSFSRLINFQRTAGRPRPRASR